MESMDHYLKKELYDLVSNEESIFDFLQEGSLDGIWYWDILNPESEWMSPRFWEVLGYDYRKKKHLSSEWQNIINQDDLAIALENFTRHCEDPGHPYDQIVRYRHSNGSTVWVRCRGIAIRDENGKPIRMLGAHTNITKEKETEVELKKSQSFLSETAKIAGVGGWELSLSDNKLFWTDDTYNLFDMDFESPINLEMTIDLFHPDYREMMSNAFDRAIHHGESFDLEAKMISGKGKELWIESRSKTIFENGEIISLRGTFQDITARKETEEEKKALQAQLNHKSRMDALGQISGGVAHDFNNVLTGIMSAAQLLQIKGQHLDDQCLSYINMILKLSDNASKLIDKMLVFSRREKQESMNIDINQIIKETIGILEKSTDKRIRFRTELERGKLYFWGNYISIENMILNICINATQALPEGGEIRLETSLTEVDEIFIKNRSIDIAPGKYIKTIIKDDGIGIPEENLDKIFDPFFTTKDVGKGTGLGLSAVYGIIKNHEGAIMVNSKVSEGTEFVILLPINESEGINEDPNVLIREGEGRILLVDDEEINRITGKGILESLGYEVLLAEDGKAAIDIYRKQYFNLDLVIMDMIMPTLNGVDALMEMKNINESCKAVIASGYSDNENLNILKDLGIQHFIRKPYSIAELSQIIFESINNRK